MADALRAEGGVFQINHPAGESTNFPEDADWQYFRDGGYAGDVPPDAGRGAQHQLALAAARCRAANSIDDAIRYWEGWLDLGQRVAATGGSDSHWVATTAAQGAGQPTTWVFVTERSVRGVLEGIRAGRTFVSHQPPAHAGPRVFLEADRDRDGVFESIAGDRVRAGARFRVRVERGTGHAARPRARREQPARRAGARGRRAVRVRVRPARDRHAGCAPQLYTPDLDAERAAVCDGLVGDQTTLCRNQLAITGLTSAIYQRP